MDNHCTSKYFWYGKSVRKENHKRCSMISEQRGKIASMCRMWTIIRAVVRTCVSKRIGIISCAAVPFVYVKSKYIRGTDIIAVW